MFGGPNGHRLFGYILVFLSFIETFLIIQIWNLMTVSYYSCSFSSSSFPPPPCFSHTILQLIVTCKMLLQLAVSFVQWNLRFLIILIFCAFLFPLFVKMLSITNLLDLFCILYFRDEFKRWYAAIVVSCFACWHSGLSSHYALHFEVEG